MLLFFSFFFYFLDLITPHSNSYFKYSLVTYIFIHKFNLTLLFWRKLSRYVMACMSFDAAGRERELWERDRGRDTETYNKHRWTETHPPRHSFMWLFFHLPCFVFPLCFYLISLRVQLEQCFFGSWMFNLIKR